MLWNLLLLLVAVLVVTIIRDGYRENPRWLTIWGQPPMSVPSRWILGPYLMVLALALIPTTREYIPKSLHPIIILAFVPVWLVLAMKEFSGPLFRLFRKRRKRFSGLNSREQRKLRREKKQLRLRRTQARRDG